MLLWASSAGLIWEESLNGLLLNLVKETFVKSLEAILYLFRELIEN